MRYEIDDRVARITLDDGKANAMSVPFFDELERLLDRADADGAGALVIAGRPGMLSGGLDLKLLPTLSRDALNELTRRFARTMLRVFTLPMPTVAACTGHAIAGGAILSFACDVRLALDGPFRIQMNEVAIGIPVPSWMLLIAGAAVPSRCRAEVLLHARVYGPREASEHGIVSELVADGGDPVGRATERAAALAALSRDAYATTKRRMRAADAERALALLEGELPG
ncbi:MAG: enoyl-CoA hydratase-related protein [Thermodesulfobacteriota bacterium]